MPGCGRRLLHHAAGVQSTLMKIACAKEYPDEWLPIVWAGNRTSLLGRVAVEAGEHLQLWQIPQQADANGG